MITEFDAPERLLMGPGPSNIPSNVLAALARPTIGHLDPAFVGMMDEIKSLLQYAFQTNNAATFAISAPASAAMECAIVNMLEPGDRALICINGVFGQRMKANVERCGAEAICVETPWGHPVDVDEVERALSEHSNIKLVGFVHAETSTGVRSDAQIICALAKRFGCLSLMDCVTSVGGIEVAVDEWEVDIAYTGTQKCLSCPPGLSPITFSEAALNVVRDRQSVIQSWFLDLKLLMGYWEGESQSNKRSYHHTAPVNALYGLHQSLLNLQSEGLHNAWQRHQHIHQELFEKLTTLGLEFMVDENVRLPQLNAVKIPIGVDDALTRSRLLNEFGIEIGAGLGEFAGKVWRIGLMGDTAQSTNIDRLYNALLEVL